MKKRLVIINLIMLAGFINDTMYLLSALSIVIAVIVFIAEDKKIKRLKERSRLHTTCLRSTQYMEFDASSRKYNFEKINFKTPN